ncbi:MULTISPECIES: oxygen-insensitive NADPH nitroreductase [unclassified Marinobacter]|uniref:oxygen-insensitive NADPH nitroreductase n=1 Tax=unclassified Marinobacter TaxID=83889 RepID=UPI000C0F08DE|nr:MULTISPECIES: oxygen-insensitive NADPH nitroreductase [unclassified Marinobacter]MAB53367.1 oxygen-insensitive NADPH nitroreductase [Marinobacter sp.]MBE96794.1 oxygen-insensitive NADPH nitroreductase [Marinobacter sp.]MBP55309.1 oxygen-insensitive NADPH nitroreductase [Marinobacter sp.]PHQ74719.1 MAG: oxygen-insensitive NADPH nitroreductase [Marinobacter sp.]
MNPTIELLKSHRSIRKFQNRRIPRELFEELIRAGQSAATSSHVQAYSIIHVVDPRNREALAELSGGQRYVAESSDFLVFCADMKRATDAAERAGAEVVRGMTEQLLVASIDTALVAQNVATAAESEGLGLCYIGGIRNNPSEVSELLRLPEHVYPVFGMCLGYPDQAPEVKPRLPLASILKEDYYQSERDAELVAEFDTTMNTYYQARTGGTKDTTWSQQLKPLFTSKLRPHMRDFLRGKGFEMK